MMDLCERRASRGRCLAITIATVTLTANSIAIALLHTLPQSLASIAHPARLYCYFSASVSVVGLVGGLKALSTPTLLYSTHLLCDILPRLLIPFVLLLPLLPSLPASLCAVHSGVPIASEFAGLAPNNASLQYAARDGHLVSGCNPALWSIPLGLAGIWIVLCLSQLWAALRLREWGHWLARADAKARDMRSNVPKENVSIDGC